MEPIFNLKVLLQLPIFRDLSGGELDELAPYFTRHAWEAGSLLFKEGEVCHDLVFLLSGRVSLQRRTSEGALREIAVLGLHEALGESGFLDSSIRTTRAVALEAVEGLVMHPDAFEALSRSNPHLANQFLKIMNRLLAEKLRKTNAEFLEAKQA